MDIRKWLNGSNGLKRVPKDPVLINKSKKSKKKSQLESSSDDEVPQTVKSSQKVIKKPVEKIKQERKKGEKEKHKGKEVSPADFFSQKKSDSVSPYFVKSKPEETPPNKGESKKRKAPNNEDSTPKKSKIVNVVEMEVEQALNDTQTYDCVEKPMQPAEILEVDKSVPETTEPPKFNYFKYKAKLEAGPKNPGSKPLPKGAENCLEGSTFVLTGTGDSLGRDETKQLIERYGGKVTSAVSGRTTFLVVGDEPGQSKLKKANEKNVSIIDEDELFKLVETRPGKKSKYEIAAESDAQISKTPKKPRKNTSPKKSPKIKKENNDVIMEEQKEEKVTKADAKQNVKAEKQVKVDPESKEVVMKNITPSSCILWVDKYKPTDLKKIVGQTGAASCAKKLLSWMKNWQNNQGCPKDQRPTAKWNGKGFDDPTGSSLRAALLSGPPGVGKTTTVMMAAEELGMDVVEFNASDTRSKKSLSSVVRDASGQYSISTSFKDNTTSRGKKVLVMDEVDGMSGNADRGGMQELLQIIKISMIPIICICNDRQHPKIRSLANHCFDLRFHKPRVEQITGAMMSICFKEGFKIAAPAVQNIIRACNQDIRQTINTLSMMASNKTDKKLEYDDVEKTATECKKDLKYGPFDVTRMIFQESKNKVEEKINLFFEDYSMIPKFTFENYPSIRPLRISNTREHLKALAEAASSFSYSNIAENKIMRTQTWRLLTTQAIFSAVIPCNKLAGSMTKMIDFPKELGKISSTNKNIRIADVLKFHTSLKCGANQKGIVTELVPTFRERLTLPLIDQSKGLVPEGVNQVIDFLDHYDLTKDDMDSILDLTQWPHISDPMKQVDTKTKSAFTRTYNKLNLKRSYNVSTEKVKKASKAKSTDVDDDLSEAEQSDGDVSAFQKKTKKVPKRKKLKI